MSDDEYGVCPYNNAHRVLRIRMPSHIIKCRKNYTGPELEQCAYNATHLVAAGTMRQHLEGCMDRHMNNNSKALANDLSIEFMYFKKKLVTKPIAALFTTIINTLNRNMASRLFNVKAASSCPCKKSSDCGWAAKIPLSSLTLVRNELKFSSFNMQPIRFRVAVDSLK
uniref:CHHC U11-48K-type domain-containing protein n=1 Tax=Glossina pallidipes TaxID=7398 RepID=A0A1A9ZFL6_GLOPL